MESRKPNHNTPRKLRPASTAAALLTWYDSHRRDLPWRAKPGEGADPYLVWVSEIMLQQTTVAAVTGYFPRFMARWPNVIALAAASQDEVLQAWAGLGYYARGRNLHRGARVVVEQFGGVIPRDPAQLITIPGIGPYTANAIGAIAFGESVAAIDTNAERVLARLLGFDEPLPDGRKRLAARAREFVPQHRPGDFAQALMDLGSAICVAENPCCGACPLSRSCIARQLQATDRFPRKKPKPARRRTRAIAYVATDRTGAVYLVRRPANGLFGGMMQPPLSDLTKSFLRNGEALQHAPFQGEWLRKPGVVRHTLTHLELEVRAYVAEFERRPNGEGIWLLPQEFSSAALPTLMRKIIAHAIAPKTAAQSR
jgi:A/G-specific adenine glycosylase